MGGILWWIIVGLIAGWVTGKLMQGEGYGTLMDIILGIVGAVLGNFILEKLHVFTSGGMISTILVAIGGAVILVLIVRLIKR
jgi:uncharacterized membrane protein YeaQ/YmgE (transglycosylase-associated protein family)